MPEIKERAKSEAVKGKGREKTVKHGNPIGEQMIQRHIQELVRDKGAEQQETGTEYATEQVEQETELLFHTAVDTVEHGAKTVSRHLRQPRQTATTPEVTEPEQAPRRAAGDWRERNPPKERQKDIPQTVSPKERPAEPRHEHQIKEKQSPPAAQQTIRPEGAPQPLSQREREREQHPVRIETATQPPQSFPVSEPQPEPMPLNPPKERQTEHWESPQREREPEMARSRPKERTESQIKERPKEPAAPPKEGQPQQQDNPIEQRQNPPDALTRRQERRKSNPTGRREIFTEEQRIEWRKAHPEYLRPASPGAQPKERAASDQIKDAAWSHTGKNHAGQPPLSRPSEAPPSAPLPPRIKTRDDVPLPRPAQPEAHPARPIRETKVSTPAVPKPGIAETKHTSDFSIPSKPLPPQHGELPTAQRQLWMETAKKPEQAKSAPDHFPARQTHVVNSSQIETRFDRKAPHTTQRTPPASVPLDAKSVPSQGRPQIKERNSSTKQPKTRPVSTPKTASRVQSIKTVGRTEGKTPRKAPAVLHRHLTHAQRLGKEKTVRELSMKSVKTARKIEKAGVRIVKAAGNGIAKGIGMIAAAGGGGVVLVLLLFVAVIGAIAASPFGIFFAGSRDTQTAGTVTVSEAVGQINREFNAELEALQAAEEYDDITIDGSQPSWAEVLAVFAAKTAAADDGLDVATLDAERVTLLKEVFADMCEVTSEVETIEHEDSDPDDEEDDSWTEKILHITITAKTARDMRTEYAFTDFQNDALEELLSDRDALTQLAGDLTITSVTALELLESLPEDLEPERRAIVETACQLVGKVTYFWGGKSLVLGWDSRWGQVMKVWAEGSETTGTYRPYGLDCSGFADWTFYNATDGAYYPGQGGGTQSQLANSTQISWEQVKPGDLVFASDVSHVGIVGGRDSAGNLLIIHCTSGSIDGVTISGTYGFGIAARPHYYTD